MTAEDVTIAEVLAAVTRRRATARVVLDQDLAGLHEQLEAELDETARVDARENRDPQAPAVAQRIADLEAEMDAARVPFVFQAVGYRTWQDLLKDHPPTQSQRDVNPRIDFNPETFPTAAIAASCVAPRMTVEEARQLEDLMTVAQWERLWVACLDANTAGGDSPKSLAAGSILRAKLVYGRTAAVMESLEASS